MTPNQGNDPYFAKAEAEHRQLREWIGSLEAILHSHAHAPAESEASGHEVAKGLDGLLSHLRAHFAEEEEGGFLEEAVSRLPRLGVEVQVLEREHLPLLADLERLVKRAAQCDLTLAERQRLARDFKTFAQALLAHEGGEMQIAETAFKEQIT